MAIDFDALIAEAKIIEEGNRHNRTMSKDKAKAVARAWVAQILQAYTHTLSETLDHEGYGATEIEQIASAVKKIVDKLANKSPE